MLRFSDRALWIGNRHPDCHGLQIAIHSYKNKRYCSLQILVPCKHLSPSSSYNTTPCALATYTHPFRRPFTQKDVHVSPLPARLPHPEQNISSITIVCLSDGSYTRGQHTQFWVQTEVHQPSVWRRFAFLCISCSWLTKSTNYYLKLFQSTCLHIT